VIYHSYDTDEQGMFLQRIVNVFYVGEEGSDLVAGIPGV
jgi:hypothetical protein